MSQRRETNPHFFTEDHDQDQHSLLGPQWAPRVRYSPPSTPLTSPTQAPYDKRMDRPRPPARFSWPRQKRHQEEPHGPAAPTTPQPQGPLGQPSQPHDAAAPTPQTSALQTSQDHIDRPQAPARSGWLKKKRQTDEPHGPRIVPPTPKPQTHLGQPSQPHDAAAQQPPDRQNRSSQQQPERQGRLPAPSYTSPPERGPQPLLRKPQRTKPITWFAAVFCTIFWVVIILGGLAVLIVYLVFRPRSPRFDISSVTLNAAYLDMGYLLNADVTLLANFTNPNRKVTVDFSYMYLELYYENTFIATQYIEPFSAQRSGSTFASVHLVTSQVRLTMNEALLLQKQIENNRIIFQVKGVFRTRSDFGSFLRYSYWLYGHCSVMVSAPPTGVLRERRCRTKR